MEATSNVSKRLEFIGVEIKRIDEKLAVLEEKSRKKQVTLEKLQEEAQRIQAGAAAS
jgi:prefoldin subunit 5